MSSYGISADVGGLFQKGTTSSSKPIFFGPGQTLTPTQKALQTGYAPLAFQRGTSGGLSSEEKGALKTRLFGDISRQSRGAQRNIFSALGRAGFGGGLAGRSFGNIESAKISAQSEAQALIEQLNQQERAQRIAELLGLAGMNAPIAVGSQSKSSGGGGPLGNLF